MKSNLGNKKTMAQNIKHYMNLHNKSRSQLCEDLGISYMTVSDWINAKTYPRIDKIEMMANYFGIEKSDLVEDHEVVVASKPAIKKIQIPLYGPISCGNGAFVDDNVLEYIAFPSTMISDKKEYFAQYAVGDSMIDDNIYDGDLIVFEKTNQIRNGEVGCFCIDDNTATCKKYYQTETSIILQPCNSNYAPIVVNFAESMNFRVLGSLVLVVNNRRARM